MCFKFTNFILGPAHIGVMISPVQGVEINQWSIPTPEPLAGPLWNGRNTYFIFYAYGLDPVPLAFWIDFKVYIDCQVHSGWADVFVFRFLKVIRVQSWISQ